MYLLSHSTELLRAYEVAATSGAASGPEVPAPSLLSIYTDLHGPQFLDLPSPTSSSQPTESLGACDAPSRPYATSQPQLEQSSPHMQSGV